MNDPPYLLKNVRNNLKKKRFRFRNVFNVAFCNLKGLITTFARLRKNGFVSNDSVISWDHIVNF